MSTFVKFWGTRGSIPTPGSKTRRYGGNTSCVEVRVDDALFVCDGGTGLRELGLDLVSRDGGISEAHLLFSHTHWDHIQGFPFFVPAYNPKSSVFVYETIPDDQRVHRLLLGQMQSDYFPVAFSDLGAKVVARHLDPAGTTLENTVVRFFEQQHPGRSFAFSFEKAGRKVVYSTDNEVDLLLGNREQSLVDLDAKRVAPDALVRFIHGADLLIADAQYTDDEYRTKVGWGHPRAHTVLDLAIQAEVGQLALYHHDPMQTDAMIEAKVNSCRARAASQGSPLTVFAAREGLELKF